MLLFESAKENYHNATDGRKSGFIESLRYAIVRQCFVSNRSIVAAIDRLHLDFDRSIPVVIDVEASHLGRKLEALGYGDA